MSSEQKNPFTPIAGKVPPYLAGRTELIDEIDQALCNAGSDPSLISLFVGARGTGKTALLSVFADMAEKDGWVVARVTSGPGMLEDILQRLQRSAAHLLPDKPQRHIKSVGVAQIGTVEWEQSEPPQANWRSKMDVIFDCLEKTDSGVLITVDEVNASQQEMVTLTTAFQHFLDENRKAALFMAGLPYGLSTLLNGKSTSFLRRAARHDLSSLSNADVEEAFKITLAQAGKGITAEALGKAVEVIGGFPYMFQLLGYRAWNLSTGRDTIGADEIEAAAKIAKTELADRVYEATYFELTEADKLFLDAMLEDERLTRQSDMASRLDKSTGHVSKYKKRLLIDGVIQERSKGILEFCLPGFREYYEERRAEDL